MYIVFVIPPSLPVQPVIEQSYIKAESPRVTFGTIHFSLSKGENPVIQIQGNHPDLVGKPPENPNDRKPESSSSAQLTPAPEPNAAQSPTTSTQTTPPAERRTFWERLFKLPPMRVRIEKALNENWKFINVRPRNIDWLLSDDGEEARIFFMDGANARQYQRLVKEYGCGFENRNGKIDDDNFDTLSEYGAELVKSYSTLMENRELIKRYYAGVFRDGRIGTESLIRISSSMWFGPFGPPRFRMAARTLHDRFQVPNHVIGPMLSSVGDSLWLRPVLFRRTAPQEFQQLLNRIAANATDDAGNAFAPALQLMVLGEEHKIPFKAIETFVADLKLKPKDFGPFSAIVFNLGVYRLASEIKCPTFTVFIRRQLDEFGADFNQESARLFVLSYREFKNEAESLNALLSPKYSDTKAYLRSIGTPITPNVWNMERIAVLTQTLTPEKRAKITQMVRELPEEVRIADIMFLADIADNEEEVKLLLNRPALIAAVKDVKIDRIVERSNNDLVKELEREIDIANRNGLTRTVRRLMNLVKEEKRTYSERVDPSKMTNIQLSRLLIFHRSLEMPGFLDTLGWNVSLDLQNERSEGGGYLGYDKDMAMVTIVTGQAGDNRQYRPSNLMRASASLALFHNHAFKDTFTERYFGFLRNIFPKNKNKNSFAGPSGWVGARKGDISAAAESELPSFIITKIGNALNPDGSKNKKALQVNLDWVIVDRQSGEALRSDRGVFTVPYFGDDELGKLKWPSRKEMKRREKEQREKCPPIHSMATVQR